jgi:hypothetical protein
VCPCPRELKPYRLIAASSSSNLKNRGFGFPGYYIRLIPRPGINGVPEVPG